MPRYIDADALLKKQTTIRVTYHCQGADEWDDYEVVLVKDINNAPTISPDEVRGVVHCGECKFWRRPPSCEGLARCETGETGIRYRSKNDFCSRGARMKGAEDGTTE